MNNIFSIYNYNYKLMVDAWLIILTVVFSIISAGFSIFIIFYFRAKDEENSVSIWIG